MKPTPFRQAGYKSIIAAVIELAIRDLSATSAITRAQASGWICGGDFPDYLLAAGVDQPPEAVRGALRRRGVLQ